MNQDSKGSVCFVTDALAPLESLAGQGMLRFGGAEKQLMEMARYLSGTGWETSFIVGDMGQADEVVGSEGLRLIRGYRHDGGLPGLRRLAYKLPRIWRALARADAGIYIIRGASWVVGVVARFARMKGRRALLWMANERDPLYGLPECRVDVNGRRIRRLDSLCYSYGVSKCDAVVAQTATQAHLMEEKRGVRPVVIPNQTPYHTGRTPKATPPYVIWVGNLRPVKRPELLLQTASCLPGVRFMGVGGPTAGHQALYDSCMAQASAMENVALLGAKPGPETDDLISGASVLLMTSETEGFPNVLLQAWAHGTPTVSTFDPDGVIGREALGYCCGTVEELSDKIMRIIADPRLREEIGERARAYVARHHAREVVMPKVEELLRRVLQEQPAAAAAGETPSLPEQPVQSGETE